MSPEQYATCRCSATEAPFSGKFYEHDAAGTYVCAACQAELFGSDSKFRSGCGWPSYFQPIAPTAVAELDDDSHGMHRTEVFCKNCGSHLGHVFNDGPKEKGGMRYCINSIALDFEPESE